MLNRREFAMAGLGAAVGVACGTAAFGEPSTGQSHKAYFQLKQPLTVIAGDSLAIVLHFKSVYPKHVLGRFRLSVSDDPEVFDREEKCLAAMKITDAWARLAAASLIIHDQRAFDKPDLGSPSRGVQHR